MKSYDEAAFSIFGEDPKTPGIGNGIDGANSCTGKIKLEYPDQQLPVGGPQDWKSDTPGEAVGTFQTESCSHAPKSVGVNCKDLDLNERTYAKCETYLQELCWCQRRMPCRL